MAKRPFWSKAGDPATYANPLVPEFSVGTDAMGDESQLASNNNAVASSVSAQEPRKTAFHRGATESNGARYAITLSDKLPQNDPASGMNLANTPLVQSRVGGTRGTFDQSFSDSTGA